MSISLKLNVWLFCSSKSKFMCLNPSIIYNNSHYLSKVHFKPFEFSVPCGRCSECKSLKKSEWRLRAYYEAKSTFESKSCSSPFVLFDTLTYDDEHICRYSDYDYRIVQTCLDDSCFNRYDVTTFFKRLRSSLLYAGYDVKNHLRYFLSSEYGDDHEYVDDRGNCRKATERPHYHVLFFVTFDIDPLVFSDFVSKAWFCGRTDGRQYKGDLYVLNKRVFYAQTAYSSMVVNYVAKYVSKDYQYEKQLRLRVRNICNILLGDLWQTTKSGRSFYTSLLRNVGVFHVESKGFGLSALDYNSLDYIVEHNSIPMLVNKKSVVADIPLPQYFKRKLFYETFWFNGQKMWRIKSEFANFSKKCFVKSRKNYVSRLRGLFSSISSSSDLNSEAIFSWLRAVLNGRSWNDYIDYILYVKGRIKFDSFYLATPLENALESILPESYNYNMLKNNRQLLFTCNTSIDREAHGVRCISFNYYPNPKNFPAGFHDLVFDMLPSDYYKDHYTYHSSDFVEYSGFDEIYSFLLFIQTYISLKREELAKYDERMYNEYKKLGFFSISI